MNDCRIIIFAKAPIAGKVKTRLVGSLGAQKAAELAKIMLFTTLEMAISSSARLVELRVEPQIENEDWFDISLPNSIEIKPQGVGDLGAKMARAAKEAIVKGEYAILIGTDCPELDVNLIEEIIGDLAGNDCVLVPAFDGGYVLLALRKFDSSIFEGIAWGTGEVADMTTEKVQALGLKLLVKTPLHDIDIEEDLQFLPQVWRDALD